VTQCNSQSIRGDLRSERVSLREGRGNHISVPIDTTNIVGSFVPMFVRLNESGLPFFHGLFNFLTQVPGVRLRKQTLNGHPDVFRIAQ
jgi:hypothetical protein